MTSSSRNINAVPPSVVFKDFELEVKRGSRVLSSDGCSHTESRRSGDPTFSKSNEIRRTKQVLVDNGILGFSRDRT